VLPKAKQVIYFYLLATIVVFVGLRKVLAAYQNPFANPLLLSSVFFIALFSFSDLSFEHYEQANLPLIWLLEPAVVALAIPLYIHIRHIRSRFFSILTSCFVGVIAGVSSGLLVAALLTQDKLLLLSLLPKSVTSPVAMAITVETGGLPSLTAGAVIMVGIFGAIAGFGVLRLAKIKDPQAQGLAMGASAHVIGTARAMQAGEQQAAFASLALIISGIITALLSPLFAWFVQLL
jgi:predicted murein hydrolase (TIGR00659 family)